MSSPRPGEVIFEVPAGVYRLVASRQGYQDGEKRDVNVTGDRQEEILLVQVPVSRYILEVRVVDYKSRPISGATVRILRASDRQEVTRGTTGTDGRVSFTLDQGSYIIEASRTGYRQPVESSVNLTSNRTEQLTLRGYTLIVTVRDSATRQPISGATVRVIDQSTGNLVDEGTTV